MAEYRSLGWAVIRSTPHAGLGLPPWPDLSAASSEHAFQQVGWLRSVWSITAVSDAISHASSDLARQVHAVCAAEAPAARETRRAALSVARYLLRMTGRPTPRGLFAGVAYAPFGGRADLWWGSEHQGVARADAEWLAEVIAQVESRPDLLERLLVVANSTMTVVGDHLVVPYQPHPEDQSVKAVDVHIRCTAPVRAAIEAARTPIPAGELIHRLRGDSSRVPYTTATAILIGLVQQRALITNAHAPSTEPDALRHLLHAIGNTADPLVTELQQVDALLKRHQRALADEGRRIRADAAAVMRRIARTRCHPVTEDLRLDVQAVLPQQIADEAGRAAMILARLSSRPHGSRAWCDYHRRFYARYGPGALVPVLEVLCDRGLGWPDGYPGTSRTACRPERSSRDAALLALVQRAVLDGQREVVLDDRLIAALGADDGRDVRLPAHLELAVRVEAAELSAVRRDRFRLVVTSVSRAAGVTTGRFLSVLDAAHRAEAVNSLASLPGDDADTVCAQLSFPPLNSATAHVTRAPRTLPLVITLAEHRDTTGADILTVEDLAVGCDSTRLYLAAPDLGKRVEAWGMHALNLRTYSPPLARFLTELPRAQHTQVTDFDWGAAADLPFLPRLRYGRTILSPARWRLGAEELPGRSATWADWDSALAGWCRRRRTPQRVHLTDGDWRLPLALSDAGHRVLLREHLHSYPYAVLEEAPAEDAVGWCGGQAHEIVIPLAVRRPKAQATPPAPVRERLVTGAHGDLPGLSPVLFAQLYGDARRQDAVLAEHLPTLLGQWDGEEPIWWFLRSREHEQDCLRLRIRLPAATPAAFGEAVGRVSSWVADLRRWGMLREVAYATSYPDTGRWGTEAARAAAEDVFAADSRAVLAQLAQPSRPHRQALTAAHFTALATAYTGGTLPGLRWLIEHVPAASPDAVPRLAFADAVRLADPRDGFAALRRSPGGTAIVDAWEERSTAVTAYRRHLPGPHTRGIDADAALGALLHAHFLRAYGVDRQAKAVCLYLARAAALACLARTNGGGPP
ncbi:lantibiotic dehydratase [Streptomyces sp. NPDC003077]|uniref:lantibiotic dehydratase n=1 Tax=Streptomyces sp. NPDC003077 TaxID=3154443 RepID=UPI0033B7973A